MNNLQHVIEECISISAKMKKGGPYAGSYAAPREAFRKLIKEAYRAELAQEDTTPAWEVEFDKRFTALDWSEKRQLVDIVGLDLLPHVKNFIAAKLAQAKQETIDYIYANLPFTTDRMENLVISKERMREVLERAREISK